MRLFIIPYNLIGVSMNTISAERKNYGNRRLLQPVRNQIEMKMISLDDLIPENHKARLVWQYVEKLDVTKFLIPINSTEGNRGRPAINPKVLLALWLYATVEGICHGRVIEQYCKEHLAFKWICGDINMNYHTINDFRSNNEEALNELITQSVAVLLKKGLISLEEIAQDGMKVRAHAGAASFRRGSKLKDFQKLAKDHVERLNHERSINSSLIMDKKRQKELQKAKKRESMIDQALKEFEMIVDGKKKS